MLDSISSPPRELFCAGNAGLLSAPCVAIVGTRHPTRYGERVAGELSSALARAGACVVSGLAYGIDACVHRAALATTGATVAVMGTGIDTVYPAGHRLLYEEVAAAGAVISEFGSGVGPFRGCFPRRNRIIAGLAQLTIVVEAGAQSGALITAGCALDAGRKVAAVPGQMDSAESAGSNLLLRDGAHVIASVDDALALMQMEHDCTARPAYAPRARPAEMGPDEATLWDALSHGPAPTDDLVTRTGLSTERCLVAVTNLELGGLVRCSSAGEVCRT